MRYCLGQYYLIFPLLLKHLLLVQHVRDVSEERNIANFAVEENFLSNNFDNVALSLGLIRFKSGFLLLEDVRDTLRKRERFYRVVSAFDRGLLLVSLYHYLVDLSILKVLDLIH